LAVVATLSKGYDLDYIWKHVDQGATKDAASYYIQASETGGEPPGRWWGPGARALGFQPGQRIEREPYDLFQDAAGGQAGGANAGACVAAAERSLLAIAEGAWKAAERHLSEAWSLTQDAYLADYPPVTIVHAVAARIALHQGDRPRAIAELTRAQRLRPALSYAVPHLAVQARIELARCHLALPDVAAARMLLREIDEMVLSPNTVRSQAMSVYGKLGASSRSQAVIRARELGLLEG